MGRQRDRDNLVVFRNPHGLVLLNRYPYANGHLMAALGDARPRLLDYSPAQRGEFWRLIEIAMDLMQRALEPQGMNVGLNEGKAAGAGLPGTPARAHHPAMGRRHELHHGGGRRARDPRCAGGDVGTVSRHNLAQPCLRRGLALRCASRAHLPFG